MTTGSIIPEKPGGNEQKWRIATWVATIFASIYIVWTGATLYYSTFQFAKLFTQMNVELSSLTLMLVANYRWLYPVWFGCALALVVGKQFFVREKAISLIITLATAVSVAVLGGWIVRALYQPMFDLTEKLSK